MLPYEYSTILKALKRLNVHNLNAFLEAITVHDQSLVGKLHAVGDYFNKRFYKFTEDHLDSLEEITLPSSLSNSHSSAKTLFVSQEAMLPPKTEMNWALKGGFDLLTLTNISVADLSMHLGLSFKIFAAVRSDFNDLN